MQKKHFPPLFGEGRTLFFLLLAEFGIDFEEGRDNIGHGTGCDDDEEEGGIAHTLLQGTGKEPRNHHRQCHKGGTECIVGRLVLTLTIINKV